MHSIFLWRFSRRNTVRCEVSSFRMRDTRGILGFVFLESVFSILSTIFGGSWEWGVWDRGFCWSGGKWIIWETFFGSEAETRSLVTFGLFGALLYFQHSFSLLPPLSTWSFLSLFVSGLCAFSFRNFQVVLQSSFLLFLARLLTLSEFILPHTTSQSILTWKTTHRVIFAGAGSKTTCKFWWTTCFNLSVCYYDHCEKTGESQGGLPVHISQAAPRNNFFVWNQES